MLQIGARLHEISERGERVDQHERSEKLDEFGAIRRVATRAVRHSMSATTATTRPRRVGERTREQMVRIEVGESRRCCRGHVSAVDRRVRGCESDERRQRLELDEHVIASQYTQCRL